ncbi:MAG: hypothetical protein H0T47_17655 [Planctomycetaceae bacterium]|nr:hypothetical protein [Planctomycetaceae bacterium]
MVFLKMVRIFALILTLAAVGCVGVMFAGGITILADMLRGRNVPFDVLFGKIAEGRAWGLTGVSLFVVACLILWFTPDRAEKPGE